MFDCPSCIWLINIILDIVITIANLFLKINMLLQTKRYLIGNRFL